eukprot:bmy_16726T0
MVNRKRAAFSFTLRCLSLGTERCLYISGSITLGHCFEVHFPSFLWEECLLSLVLQFIFPFVYLSQLCKHFLTLHQKGVFGHQLFFPPLLPSLPACILLLAVLLYSELST